MKLHLLAFVSVLLLDVLDCLVTIPYTNWHGHLVRIPVSPVFVQNFPKSSRISISFPLRHLGLLELIFRMGGIEMNLETLDFSKCTLEDLSEMDPNIWRNLSVVQLDQISRVLGYQPPNDPPVTASRRIFSREKLKPFKTTRKFLQRVQIIKCPFQLKFLDETTRSA